MLSGTEVKSLREGRGHHHRGLCRREGGELWLFNAYIPEYHGGNRFNHERGGRASCCCTGAR